MSGGPSTPLLSSEFTKPKQPSVSYSIAASPHQRLSRLSTVSQSSQFGNPILERSRLSRSSRSSSDPRPRARSLVGRRRLTQESLSSSGAAGEDEYVRAVIPHASDDGSDTGMDDIDDPGTPRQPPHKRSKCTKYDVLGLLPPILWLPKYQCRWIFPDFLAGLTVGMMCIPQGLAYGVLSGLPPVMGLYSTLIPPLLYCFMGTSMQLHVGATSLSSIVSSELLRGILAEMPHEVDDPDAYHEWQALYMEYMLNMTFLCGLFYFFAGLIRAGVLTNFISHTVLSAFMSGLAVVLSTSQLANFLGISVGAGEKNLYTSWYDIVKKLYEGDIHWQPITLGSLTLAFILGCKYIKIPPFTWIGNKAQLITVIAAVIIGWQCEGHCDLKSIGDIPKGFPSPLNALHGLDYDRFVVIAPASATLAVAMFLETFPIASAFANKNEYVVNTDQELRALGITHMVSCFFRCYPHSGSATRTTVMDNAGGKSPVASLISVITVGVCLSFLTPVFRYIPKCVLAAILLAACVSLFDFHEFRFLFRAKPRDATLWLITFACAIIFGVSVSLAVGAVLSLMMLSYRNMRPHTRVIGCIPGTNIYQNMKEFYAPEPLPHTIIVGFDDSLTYLNSAFLRWKLEDVELRWLEQPPLKNVILDMQSVSSVDSSGIHTIEELIKAYEKRGVRFYMANVQKHAKKVLARALGFKWHSCAYEDINDAVNAMIAHAEEDSRILEETLELEKSLESTLEEGDEN